MLELKIEKDFIYNLGANMQKEPPTKKLTIHLKRSSAPAQVRLALDHIIYELEHYGRTTTSNGKASRFLSYRMRYPKNDEKIFFTWSKQHHRSIITLDTETRLEQISPNKIRLIHKRHIKEKE